MKKAPAPVHIGTSGWHYLHWRGPFYPDKLPTSEFLSFYARRFHTVEINNSFYRLPLEKTFRQWHDTAPPDFVFAVKASRFITHMKKLTDPHRTLPPFLDRVAVLGEKLGPLLFQLPPHWSFHPERLQAFLAALPPSHKYALEFRDPSWLNDQAYDLLSQAGAALCIYDFAGRLSPRQVTAPFVYIRLHGPGGPYQGCYDLPTLRDWAQAISAWAHQGKEVFCYFDNDEAGFAVLNALTLQDLLKT